MTTIEGDTGRGGLGAAVVAGAAYFGVVFTVGFVFGIVRELVLVDALALPQWLAVLIEIPFMLAVAFWACRGLVRHLEVPAGTGPRLTMGLVAFALLMGAEAALSVLLLERSVPDHLASFAAPAAAIGLAGQVAFALLPLAVSRRG